MANKFGHKYELYCGMPTELIAKHNLPTGYEGTVLSGSRSPNSLEGFRVKGYIDYLTIPKDVKKITNPIQMEAEVKYSKGTNSAAPQTATIKVYNLSKDTLNYIEAQAAVVLKAGYEQDVELPVIFVGQVERVYTADNVTTIICKDAGSVLKNVLFTASYPKGQTYNFVLLQMIKAFSDNGVPLGDFIESDASIQSLVEGQAFSGKLSTNITEVCNSIGFIWYISKGRLYVHPRELDRKVELVTISADQVVGTVAPNDDKSATTSVDKASKPVGVKVTTFLNGDIGVHTYMRLSYGTYEGDYTPDSVKYSLNWKNGPWTVTVESQKVKEYAINTS